MHICVEICMWGPSRSSWKHAFSFNSIFPPTLKAVHLRKSPQLRVRCQQFRARDSTLKCAWPCAGALTRQRTRSLFPLLPFSLNSAGLFIFF